jgi:hypothetical protein
MNWYAIVFVATIIVIMIVAGCFLIRSWLRNYTYAS